MVHRPASAHSSPRLRPARAGGVAPAGGLGRAVSVLAGVLLGVGASLLVGLLFAPARAQVADTPAGADGAAPVAALRLDDDDAMRRQIQQKLQLVARMIGDTASVQRIQASGNVQAQTNYEEARVHHAASVDFLARNDLTQARRSADEALRHIGMARRLAPDAPTRQAAARQRHDQLLASLDRLVAAWRSRADAAMAAGTPPPAKDSERLTATQGLMASAAHLAVEKRYDEASNLLVQAERHVLEGMNGLLQSATLDYSDRPATPAEALDQELARHRGLADLVPLAISDLKPRPEAQALIERYNEASTTLRTQALQQQQAGDVTQALAHIRNATMYVQRALEAAGLVVPQAIGEPR
ncbi:MAG: hypothetical protein IPG93_03355 [Burkholderiales bacterium]|nr:hypothetical protein [Burkholderiales bacterium]